MIYLTGDTHLNLDIDKLNTKFFKEQKTLTKDDYVIILGDVGLTWDNSKKVKDLVKWLEERNFTTLFVDGNHENFDTLNSLPVETWNGGRVHKVSDSVIHLMRGQVFNIDGKTFFTMGGGYSIDVEYRIPNRTWWKEEIPSKEELEEGLENLRKYNNKVDYILTHDCSNNVLHKFTNKLNFIYDENSINNELKKYFYKLEEIVDFKQWYFGHYHLDYEVDNKHRVLYDRVEKIKEYY